MSSVRLDNLVYTVKCFEEARTHLKDDGLVAVTFSVPKKWIGARLGEMLDAVFGEEPLTFEVGYDGGITFIAGPGAANLRLSRPSLATVGCRQAPGLQGGGASCNR